jgi:hypothetical protein
VTEGTTLPQLCGFLTGRIAAALLEEQLVATMAHFTAGEESDEAAVAAALQAAAERPAARIDFNALEARLKRELVFIGLLEDPEQVRGLLWVMGWRRRDDSAPLTILPVCGPQPEPARAVREDDEVCFKLRHLQNQLRVQVALNSARRARIHARAFAYLAYQEYETLMDDVHKQIEAIYTRRHVRWRRVPALCGGSRSDSHAPTGWWSQSKAGKRGRRNLRLKPMADADRRLLERADKLVQRLASVFPPERFRPPAASIFEEWEHGANPAPEDLIDAVPYPSRAILHPVLHSLAQGVAPSYPTAQGGSVRPPAPSNLAAAGPSSGGGALLSTAGASAPPAAFGAGLGGWTTPAGGDEDGEGGPGGAAPPVKRTKVPGLARVRAKTSAGKGVPPTAFAPYL